MFPAADSVKRILPGSRFLQAADQPEQGRLTGSVFSYQSINCTLGNVHGKIV